MKISKKYGSGIIFIFTLAALLFEQQSGAGPHEKEKSVRKKPYDHHQPHSRQRRRAIVPGDQVSKDIQEADLNHKLNGIDLAPSTPSPK